MFWDVLDFFFGCDIMNTVSDVVYPIYDGVCAAAAAGDPYFNMLATALEFILT